MTKRADKELLGAVLEPRKAGALQRVADAISAGADPNAICPESSTPTGRVRAGSTLLTHSIHEGASNAVKKLLECGAEPNLPDQNGWTAWMASTLVDESKRIRIQESLTKYGADRTGEHIGQLARAIADGNVGQAIALIETDRDLDVLATFRVDLVGHQIRMHNAPMLEFLLEHKMTPSPTNFLNAIRNKNAEAVDILLRYGTAPEGPDDNETPLMTAAAMGEMKIVQRLVEAGADVNRSADEGVEWTASFYARQAGKTDVADWLAARMSNATMEEQDRLRATRDPKYQLLYEQATASESLSTDDIVAVLTQWDEECSLTISEARGDALAVTFASLPENIDGLLAEVLDLCPDAFGHESEIRKELAKNKKVFLWWD